MTARGPQSQPNHFESNALTKTRRKTVNDATPTKLPVPKASPARSPFFGPRSLLDAQAESLKQRPRGPPTYDSSTAYHDLIRGFNSSQRKGKYNLSKPADTTGRNEPPILADLVSPQLGPSSEVPKPLPLKPSTASLRSYKTASSQLDMSETSADTVVEWSASASFGRLHPSTHDASPFRTSVQRSFLHERPPIDVTKKEEGKVKKKEQESINASTQTSPSTRSSMSQVSRNTAMADAIVHWPSLRKSPLITDLSAGVESATASVLDLGGYTDPSSPGKANQEVMTSPKKTERHSSSSSRNGRYIPPRLPLKISPSTASFRREPIMQTCTCEPHIQATITTSVHTLRVEMEQGFQAQRLWLEDLVRGREDGRLKLEEENRWLKAALARAEKGKERSD